MTTTLKRTPLYPYYAEIGAKTIDFGGWDLPVQFTGIKAEHEAVRTAAGLFDVSHMGEIKVSGTGAYDFLQKMLTNDLSKIEIGQVQYTAMCLPTGGTVDDLLTYCLAENEYLLVVNASNCEKDYQWLLKHQVEDVFIQNVSEEYALVALQGPLAAEILTNYTDFDLSILRPFRFQQEVKIANESVLLSRTGYTGEDGFEIYGSPTAIQSIWNTLMVNERVVPAGLGARDTLRFEAGLPLYGQELSETISPLEAGLGFIVKLTKDDFIGKEALQKQKEKGIPRKLVGLEMIDKGIPRTGYEVWVEDQVVGQVTTGTQSPTLGKNIGFALLASEYATIGTVVEVQVRKRRLQAIVCATPFYKR